MLYGDFVSNSMHNHFPFSTKIIDYVVTKLSTRHSETSQAVLTKRLNSFWKTSESTHSNERLTYTQLHTLSIHYVLLVSPISILCTDNKIHIKFFVYWKEYSLW